MALAELGAAIDGLSIAVDAGELAEVLALHDRLRAVISDAVGDFDAAELWDVEAAISLKDWLIRNARLTDRDASVMARVAQRLRDMPTTKTAWLDGRLSGGQVQIITAFVTAPRLPIFQDHEPDLLPRLEDLSTHDTRVAMATWADAADDLLGRPDPPERPNTLHLSKTLEDRGELRGSLDPTNTALLGAALQHAERRDGVDESRTPAERRADALSDIARHYLDTNTKPARHRRAPHVELSLSLEDLRIIRAGVTPDGSVIDGPAASALACGSVLRRVVMIDGELLDYGRAVYEVPAALFFAVRARDRHCRWPGCYRNATHCQAHHVVHWWHGGTTDIANLALLCSRHHHRLHKPDWHAKLLPDATLEITTPTGAVLTSHPVRAGPLF